MPEESWVQLTFERGLNQFDRRANLLAGEAQELENFEFLENGGLTPRPGWRVAGNAPSGGPSVRRGRGLYTDYYESGQRKLVLATYDNGTGYYIHKTNVGDPRSFTSFSQVEGPLTITDGYRFDPVDFAQGMNYLMYTNPGFPSGQLRVYDGSTVSALAIDGSAGTSLDGIAGRAIVYYLNRFWVGGSVTNPTYLRFSEIGKHDTWNTDENFIPVGQQDGMPIEDIVVWNQGLLIGKQNGLYFLSGSTLDSFQLSPPLSRRLGCARGQSLIATEGGVFVMGIDGNVYLYDGADLKPLTSRVFVATPPASGLGFMSAAYIAEKLYVTSSTGGTTVYVWSGGRWRKETTDSTLAASVLAAYDDSFLLGLCANDGPYTLLTRQERGSWGVSSWRDPTHDVGVAQTYRVTTPEYWPKGPMGKVDLRSVYVRYEQFSSGPGEPFTITPVVSGTAVTSQAKTIGNKDTAGRYAERRDFAAWVGGENVAIKFSYSPSASEQQAYVLEEVWAVVLRDQDRR